MCGSQTTERTQPQDFVSNSCQEPDIFKDTKNVRASFKVVGNYSYFLNDMIYKKNTKSEERLGGQSYCNCTNLLENFARYDFTY